MTWRNAWSAFQTLAFGAASWSPPVLFKQQQLTTPCPSTLRCKSGGSLKCCKERIIQACTLFCPKAGERDRLWQLRSWQRDLLRAFWSLSASKRQKNDTQATLVLNRDGLVWLLETASSKETRRLKHLLCSSYHALILNLGDLQLYSRR